MNKILVVGLMFSPCLALLTSDPVSGLVTLGIIFPVAASLIKWRLCA